MKRKTGFYIFLFMCMIGLGAAAFFMNNGKDKPQTAKTNTSSVLVRSYMTSSEESSGFEPVSSQEESSQPVSSEESQVPTAAKADFFVYPMSGEIVTDYTQDTLIFSKTYNDWRTHTAIDIKGSFGESVHASGDGVVEEVYYDELYGNTIVIDHGNGIEIYYCGLDQVDIKQGQTVYANDTIGTLGELPCENLDGVHLHFAVKKDSQYMNPMDIIS